MLKASLRKRKYGYLRSPRISNVPERNAEVSRLRLRKRSNAPKSKKNKLRHLETKSTRSDAIYLAGTFFGVAQMVSVQTQANERKRKMPSQEDK